MTLAYVLVTLAAAAANAWAAAQNAVRPAWLLANMDDLGVPRPWLPTLGGLKAAGALGLLVGLALPVVGVAAAVGLVLFFVGAVATVVRAACWSQFPYPVVFLGLAAASLALRLATW